MNKPSLITGIVLLVIGLLMVIVGLAIGGSSLDDQEYEEVANEGDFVSPREGTFMYDYSPDSSFGTKIDIASKAQQVLVFDLTVEDRMGSPVLSQKSRMTPYTRELELTSLETYTITLVFEENVSLMNFSVIIWEKTLSESAIGSCCMGLMLPGLGILMMLVGLILIIVGVVVGRKKEVMADPWNRPQDLVTLPPQTPPFAQQPVGPLPPTGGQGPVYPPHPGTQSGQTAGDGVGYSPNVLRPPPGP